MIQNLSIKTKSKEDMDKLEVNLESWVMEFAKGFAPLIWDGEYSFSFDRHGDTEATVIIDMVFNSD
jgi:hypothetical protein